MSFRRAGPPSLDAFPEEVLRHVLSFLPAQEAVRTCVLARRWRKLWKKATGLRILCGNGHEAASVSELREFVHHLLLHRERSPLETCVIKLCRYEDEDIPCIKLWIRHVLMLNVQVLTLDIDSFGWDPWLQLHNLPLDSKNLKRLTLKNRQFNDRFLDFSSCPALEALEFDGCGFDCQIIMSKSLKFLRFNNDCDFGMTSHTHIYAPNLISLWLQVGDGRTPSLWNMPSLVEAVVKIKFSDDSKCEDKGCPSCDPARNNNYYDDSDKEDYDPVDKDYDPAYFFLPSKEDTVLFCGLSEARSLVLMSDISGCIFRRDLLTFRHMFSNLKTLTLNEYSCMPGDLLTCILEHSPILEKLTLQLFCKEPKVQMRGSLDTTERSNAISEHLKIVEIKCEALDEKVVEVLEVLEKLSIFSGSFRIRRDGTNRAHGNNMA